jgi:hypothetical protein
LGPDAGEHERSHNRHAALLFGVKLRNKNAKWEIAEKTKKKTRQVRTFSSSLFTNSLPVDWTSPSNRISRNFSTGCLSGVFTLQRSIRCYFTLCTPLGSDPLAAPTRLDQSPLRDMRVREKQM